MLVTLAGRVGRYLRFHLHHRNARKLACERGSLSTTFAIILPFVVATVGAAADYNRMLLRKTKMQTSLDATALALSGQITKLSRSELERRVRVSFQNSAGQEIALSTRITVEPNLQTGRLRLTASGTIQTAFMAIVGKKRVGVKVLSEATASYALKPCVIALDPVASGSFSLSGNGSVSAPSCAIYVNSSSTSALSRTGGSGTVTAQSIYVVGDYSRSMAVSPLPLVKQPPAADPLASLPEPTVPSSCTYTNMSVTTARVFPAGSVYCGNISFGSGVTFQPGIHYFKSASVSVSSGASLSGTGVMLYFDGNSAMTKSTGGGQFQITAPSSGTYQGVAVFGSRKGNKMQTFTLTGDKDYFVNGTVYLPAAKLSLLGSADLTVSSRNGYVIAQQFSYNGNSSFTMDAFGGPVPSAMQAGTTRLTN